MPPLPPVTKALMLICAAVFLVQELLPILPVDQLFALWSLGSGRFWPWQVVTYGLLHGSLAHLGFNLLGLWMFGSDLERLWGRHRYQQMLLASVVAAALMQLLVFMAMGSRGSTVGISGAVYGLLLAFGLMFPQRQFDLLGLLPMALILTGNQILGLLGMALFVVMLTNRNALPVPPIPVKAKVIVAIYIVAELAMGIFGTNDGVAHFAHLGGMLGAWLMISWWRGKLPFSPPPRRR